MRALPRFAPARTLALASHPLELLLERQGTAKLVELLVVDQGTRGLGVGSLDPMRIETAGVGALLVLGHVEQSCQVHATGARAFRGAVGSGGGSG